MRSLLIRIFLSFWLIIGITIGIGALGGYWYGERIRDQFENFDLGDTVLEASQALQSEGRSGLESWLITYTESSAVALFVFDDHRKELLGRTVPRFVYRDLDRHRRDRSERDWDHDHDDPRNLRRARPHTQLLGPDGTTYTFVASRFPGAQGDWSPEMARHMMLLLAIIVSAFVSWLLARAITRPVTKLRHATVSLAEGDLDIRVAESVGSRRDELGLLARDFDLMADNLQRSARQQTELSRNISHELRSPLARMRVALELARRQSGDLAEFDRIDSEAERLDSLIGQILSYTRLDASVSQKTEVFDLADLIQEVVENVNFECRSAGIDGVSVQAHAVSATPMTGHRYAMASAIENILRNAVRHSPTDGVVSIALRQENAEVIVDIVDQGPGVDDSELPHLFDAFFRTSGSTADTSNHGTGLGLAIAKRAVNINGGKIAADSADGGGLRVTIVLPRPS